jgi:hypothetical protein
MAGLKRRISLKNYGKEGNLLSLPLYLAGVQIA